MEETPAWGCFTTVPQLTRPGTVPLGTEKPSRCQLQLRLRRDLSRKSSRKHQRYPGKSGICKLSLCLPALKPALLIPIPKRFCFFFYSWLESPLLKDAQVVPTRSQQRHSPGSPSSVSHHPWISACLIRQNIPRRKRGGISWRCRI